MRDVVFGGDAIDRIGAALTTGRAVRIHDGQVEAAYERSPGYACGAQQIADVLTSHGYLVAGRVGANVADRVGIAGHGQRTVAAADHFIARSVDDPGTTVRLA